MERSDLLAAYDEQLRLDAETPGAVSVTRLGPLVLATYDGGRGFVTYLDLGGADADEVRRLVGAAVDHYEAEPAIRRVEWKTRDHDRAPGLHVALLDHGFVPEKTESVMIGEIAVLVSDAPVPDGVTLRLVTEEPDVRAMCEMLDVAFADPDPAPERVTASLMRRLALGDGMELWVAEAGGRMVSAGRLEPVAGTEFAGIWGGATLPEWRGRGLYKALLDRRARSALTVGKTLVHSDSTEFSRPILERAGLVKVSTTTPYVWRRRDHE